MTSAAQQIGDPLHLVATESATAGMMQHASKLGALQYELVTVHMHLQKLVNRLSNERHRLAPVSPPVSTWDQVKMDRINVLFKTAYGYDMQVKFLYEELNAKETETRHQMEHMRSTAAKPSGSGRRIGSSGVVTTWPTLPTSSVVSRLLRRRW